MSNVKKNEGTGAMKFLMALVLAALAAFGYYYWNTNLRTQGPAPVALMQAPEPPVEPPKTMEAVRRAPVRIYYDNGNLKAERNFKEGKLDGVYRTYYENGILKEEGNYKDDKLDGVLKRYDQTGKQTEEEVYQDNQLISRKTLE